MKAQTISEDRKTKNHGPFARFFFAAVEAKGGTPNPPMTVLNHKTKPDVIFVFRKYVQENRWVGVPFPHHLGLGKGLHSREVVFGHTNERQS